MKRPFGIALLLTVIVVVGAWWLFNDPKTSQNNQTESNNGPTGKLSLEADLVLGGLNKPWDIAFLPDSTMLFSEKSGAISIFADGSKRRLIDIKDVYDTGEAGLMGIAVDPEFDKNHYIYACYATNSDIRLSRWTFSDNSLALTDKHDVITNIPLNTGKFPGRHSGCRPRFGPDGNLWVGTGDAAQNTNPQNPKSLGGKILRVDRDGNAVDGNMPPPFDERIYSYGHRNIQGIAFLPPQLSSDDVAGYSIEHGTNRDDEINRLITGNFGWEPGPAYDESAPMTNSSAFPDSIEAAWSSGRPTIAPSGGTFISGEEWGVYDGMLAVAVLKDQHIRLFSVEGDKTLKVQEELYKKQYGRIRTVVQSPDGGLYFSTDNGNGRDVIIRVYPK